jgi:dihydroneopterin aldolase
MQILAQKIILQRMVVDCQIGIHAHEKAGPQAITVDVTLGLAASLAAQNDDILTTVDYDQVWNGVHRLVKARDYNLQETLCAAIAELCLSLADVDEVWVRTGKPDVYPDCDSISYQLHARA